MAIQGTTVQRPWVGLAASALLLLCGLFLWKLSILDVLEAAERHDPTLSYSLRGILLAPVATLLGVLACGSHFFTRGDPEKRRSLLADPRTRKLKPAGIVVAVAVLAVAFGTFMWVRGRLQSYGYEL